MPLDATSATAAKREMPAQDSDDFAWVNAWAASAGPSAPAVAPAITPVAPALQALIEPTQPATQVEAYTPPAPSSEATAPLDPPTFIASEIMPPVPFEAAQDGASAPLVPEAAPAETEAASVGDTDPEAAAESAASTDEGDELPAAEEQPKSSAPISFLDFARRAKRSLFSIVARNADLEPEPEALTHIPGSSDPVAAGTTFPLAPDLSDQLERDIAEIEIRRDALYAEWERSQRWADPAARSRTSDYVPILLGTVLGFTLLVVFGAAASFVSLR